MRSERVFFLNTDGARQRRGSQSGLRPEIPRVRGLEWCAIAVILFAGGCVYPCGSGVCNSRESLFTLPATRYNGSERLSGNQQFLDRDCKAKAYLTFNKYRPWCDDWTTTVTAKRCANRILLQQQWSMKKLMSADYKGGFRQAFIDVAHGSDGELPAVPPPVYWNAHFRSDSGQRRAECWFSGYRAGAAMAAVRLAPLKRIAASYDWTVPDSPAPFAGGECLSRGIVQQFPPGIPGQTGRWTGPGQWPQSSFLNALQS